MVDRLIEKTGPAVQLESGAQIKGEKTRERILDVAYESIVKKGSRPLQRVTWRIH